MALLSAGNGPRALAKAQGQLEVLIQTGRLVGHIPRVVGPSGIETTTQPPGILTWAAQAMRHAPSSSAHGVRLSAFLVRRR
jgi:hypothetical protein